MHLTTHSKVTVYVLHLFSNLHLAWTTETSLEVGSENMVRTTDPCSDYHLLWLYKFGIKAFSSPKILTTKNCNREVKHSNKDVRDLFYFPIFNVDFL